CRTPPQTGRFFPPPAFPVPIHRTPSFPAPPECQMEPALRRRKLRSTLEFCQRRKVKDFFIKFKKKLHFADFLTKQTLDFVLHRLFCGLAEMHTDDIGCLSDLLSDSRARGGVGCGIVHSKS